MVVVCTAYQQANTLPAVVRLRNTQGSSFEIRLQNPAEQALNAEKVDCLVAEQGVWQLPDGRKFEAQTFRSTRVDSSKTWSGQILDYAQSYSQPVVLGQVMSHANESWGAFWSRGSLQTEAPGSDFRAGLHVGEDPLANDAEALANRFPETLGYMVFEAGNGAVDGNSYEVAAGPQTILGYDDTPPGGSYELDFDTAPTVALATITGMAGSDGGWAMLQGNSALASDSLALVIDEDQQGDNERQHPAERVAYLVFEQPVNLELNAP
jgi:hypothetical protein